MNIVFFMLVLLTCPAQAATSGPGSQRTGEQKPTPVSPRQAQQVPLPAPAGHVNDYAHALNDSTREQLEQALTELKTRSKIEFAVALMNTTGGKPIVEYSKTIFQGWKIGGPGEGLLLLLAIEDHQWHIQTTRGLARDLTAEKIKDVGALMNPSLGQEHYSEGVRRGVEAIIKVLAVKRGFAPISIPAPLLSQQRIVTWKRPPAELLSASLFHLRVSSLHSLEVFLR